MAKAVKSGGVFEDAHQNPPKAFNPDYRPYAADVQHAAVEAMSNEGFYQNHTREECAAELRKRYDAEMARRESAFQSRGGIDNPDIFHPIAREIENQRQKPIHDMIKTEVAFSSLVTGEAGDGFKAEPSDHEEINRILASHGYGNVNFHGGEVVLRSGRPPHAMLTFIVEGDATKFAPHNSLFDDTLEVFSDVTGQDWEMVSITTMDSGNKPTNESVGPK